MAAIADFTSSALGKRFLEPHFCMIPSPLGPVFKGSDAPNIEIKGTSSAAARCNNQVSSPTTKRDWFTNPATSPKCILGIISPPADDEICSQIALSV